MRYFTHFVALSLIYSISFTPVARAKSSETYHYIALGDSITAGFLGFSKISDNEPTQREVLLLRSMNVKADEPKPPRSVLGVRYPAALESKKMWSWASGKKSGSIRARLKDWLSKQTRKKVDLKMHNVAESSARAEHMPRQMRIALEKIKKSERSKIALITLLIGANDACAALDSRLEDAQKFKDNLHAAIAQVADIHNEDLKIFVSSIPNVPNMSLSRILNHHAYFRYSCDDVRRKIVNFCPNLLNWKTADEYEAGVARVNFVNQQIQAEVERARATWPHLNIIFDDSFYHSQIDGLSLAYDCFHPGKRGQPVMAETMWSAMPWFK